MRLFLAAAALVIACFSILPAPHPLLGWLALVASEWGHILALFTILLLPPGWTTTPEGRRVGALVLLASALAIAPVLRAVPVARALPARLAAAFDPVPPTAFCGQPPRSSGLLVSDLLLGVRPGAVAAEELTYSSTDGVALRLRVLRSEAPDCPAPAPALIVVQGPTWRFDDNVGFAPLDSYLAARGYAVVNVGYRPPPRWHHPVQTQDVAAAIAYVQNNATRLGLNPSRLALLGRGMEGQLALQIAYGRGFASIRGVVAMYPTTDLLALHRLATRPAMADTRTTLEQYLGGTPDRAATAYRRASPINSAGARSPPTLLIHGDRDSVVPVVQSVRLDERLEEAGRKHLLLRLPWGVHRCDANLAGPCGQISAYAIERFLASVLR